MSDCTVTGGVCLALPYTSAGHYYVTTSPLMDVARGMVCGCGVISKFGCDMGGICCQPHDLLPCCYTTPDCPPGQECCGSGDLGRVCLPAGQCPGYGDLSLWSCSVYRASDCPLGLVCIDAACVPSQDAAPDVASSGPVPRCPGAIAPEIVNNSFLCPPGSVLGVDSYNAAACCLVDGSAGPSMLDASTIDATSDAMGDAKSDGSDGD